jgi:signal transduction histidine kinase
MEQNFSEMAAALAHEIKNPAAVALAHVNLLRLDGEDEEQKLTHHLNHIENALTNICDLVRDMLASSYSRSEAYEVDLYKILTEILETYRAAWPEISFVFNVENECLPCLGHETSLRMIFSNLIKNSVEALEFSQIPSAEIEILAAYDKEFLNITICDNGKAGNRSDDKTHGNGLGLAICRNLANGIGAQFLAAPSENGGCMVTVRLRVTTCPSFA